jgi:hypothetical protein
MSTESSPPTPRAAAWPFDAYDAFGYLAPGATLLAVASAFELSLRWYALDKDTTLAVARYARAALQTHWSLPVLFLALTIVAAYVAGHIVSSFSGLFLDRGLVVRGYGYPYETLLGIRRRRSLHLQLVSGSHKAAFFWLNAYLLARWVSQGTGSRVAWTGVWLSELALVLVAGLGITSIACRLGLLQAFTRHDHVARRQAYRRLATAGRWAARVGYELLAWPISRYIDTRSSFTPQLVSEYRRLFRQATGFPSTTAKTNNYWFSQLFVSSRSREATTTLMKWLYLYSFSRNLAAAFFLVLPLASARLWLGGYSGLTMQSVTFWLPLVSWFSGAMMLLRYYYLYAGYYSKYLFRAFVFLARADAPRPERRQEE